jgi:hypothetical protein
MKGFNHRKAVQALNFFARKEGGSINKMKAIKLIWLSDRLHLRRFGRTITGDTYFALPFGPVASNTRDLLEASPFCSDEELAYGSSFIVAKDQYNYSTKADTEEKVFSRSDLNAFEEVYQVYGHLNKFELSELSHLFPEWKKWETALAASQSRYLMDLQDFFKDSPSDNPIFQDDPENLDLALKIFNRSDFKSQ